MTDVAQEVREWLDAADQAARDQKDAYLRGDEKARHLAELRENRCYRAIEKLDPVNWPPPKRGRPTNAELAWGPNERAEAETPKRASFNQRSYFGYVVAYAKHYFDCPDCGVKAGERCLHQVNGWDFEQVCTERFKLANAEVRDRKRRRKLPKWKTTKGIPKWRLQQDNELSPKLLKRLDTWCRNHPKKCARCYGDKEESQAVCDDCRKQLFGLSDRVRYRLMQRDVAGKFTLTRDSGCCGSRHWLIGQDGIVEIGPTSLDWIARYLIEHTDLWPAGSYGLVKHFSDSPAERAAKLFRWRREAFGF